MVVAAIQTKKAEKKMDRARADYDERDRIITTITITTIIIMEMATGMALGPGLAS